MDDVFHVFAHVARFGKRRRVGNGKGHVERTGERLRQKRLARARGAHEQDVGLLQFDVFGGRLVL